MNENENTTNQKPVECSKNNSKGEIYSYKWSKKCKDANKHMKKCSKSFNIRRIQIKTTMKYHLTYTRMAILKIMGNSK